MWKALLLSVLPCLFLFPSTCRADEVLLSNTNNHLYGAYGLHEGQGVLDAFSLDQTTDVTSIQTGIAPEDFGFWLGYNWQVVIGGQGITLAFDPGVSSWTGSLILPAGVYTVGFLGGSCPATLLGGASCEVAGIDYYIGLPYVTYTEIGGTMAGPFGFTLTGSTVAPEPSPWILLGTALLLAIPARKYLFKPC